MTVGQLFTELLQLLEIGNCRVSAKQRAMSVQPYFDGELMLSPSKQIQVLSLQRAYTKLATSGFSWDIVVTIEQELLIGEAIRCEIPRTAGYVPDDLDLAEIDLIDALQEHLQLDVRRATSRP